MMDGIQEGGALPPGPPRTGAVPWQEIAGRLRPFVARRVDAGEVDDVVQDVFLRMQRGLPALRDDEKLGAWMYQVARSAIADSGRAHARRPVPSDDLDEAPADPEPDADRDRDVARALAGCVAVFVARLPSPYREAVTLVELDGLTAREAAERAAISVSGMKSRVQRGRAQLRQLFEACCEIAVDARGKPVDAVPRAGCRPRSSGEP
jgi:RNA polymerase sigma-70 factor, ECF subfamily